MGLITVSESRPGSNAAPSQHVRGSEKRRSIKRRWFLCCCLSVALIVAAAVTAFSICVHSVLDAEMALKCTVGAIFAGLAVIAAISLINLRFIRSILRPIKALTAMAGRISEGSCGIQADKSENDEIGDLVDSINEMSDEIAMGERLQTEFISSVSHELRTPLTAITGWSETLSYDDAIQGDSRRGVAIIAKEAGRLTKMVSELLEFTRIQGGRFALNIERMDVSAELEDILYSYGELLRREGMELCYEPPAEALPLMDGDPERLGQVFLNILDNAAKYGKGGGKITVSLRHEGGEAVIRVRDFGRGIPPEELPHVKERFYKGSSKERGSGIGLAVCEEIVTRHRGKLLLENAPGGGVLVTIRLPAGKNKNSEKD